MRYEPEHKIITVDEEPVLHGATESKTNCDVPAICSHSSPMSDEIMSAEGVQSDADEMNIDDHSSFDGHSVTSTCNQTAPNTHALNLTADTQSNASKGILKFFRKATKEEKQEQQMHDIAQHEAQTHDMSHFAQVTKTERQMRIQEINKLRQQQHRERKRAEEIEANIRSPGGRKKKV